MNSDHFKDLKLNLGAIKLPQTADLAMPNFGESVSEMRRLMDEATRLNRLKQEKEENYKSAVLNALHSIEKNTGGIAELVQLVNTSNEKQDQIIKLLSEIFSVSTAKTKEEAQNKFNKALGKIQSLGTTVESVQTLVGLLNTVYNTVQPLLT